MKKHLALSGLVIMNICMPLQSLKAMDDHSLTSVLQSPPVFIVGTMAAGVALGKYLLSSDQAQLEKVIRTSTNVEGVLEAQERVECKTVLPDRLLMAVRNNSVDDALICLNAGCSPDAATSFIGQSTGQRYTPIEATHVWSKPEMRDLLMQYRTNRRLTK
ncbi:MAG: hypothetical protein AB7F19_02735 [Candidatus Babeliales bacterium]